MVTATLRKPEVSSTVAAAVASAPADGAAVNAAPAPAVAAKDAVIDVTPTTEAQLFDNSAPEPGTDVPTSPGEATAPAAGAVATTASQPVAHRYSDDCDEDGFGQSDLKFPILRVVQGSGKLSQLHPVGTLVFGNDIENLTTLAEPPKSVKEDSKPIRFIPVKLKKQYREVLSQEEVQAGQMARIVDTTDEVEALGGTTQWVGDEKPSWRPSARCFILIEQPEGVDDPMFSSELDGKKYCPAMFFASNSNYGTFAQTLFNTARISLMEPVLDGEGKPTRNAGGFPIKKVCYPKNVWTLSIGKRLSGDFTIFVAKPKLLVKELTGPEARVFCNQLIEVSSSTSAE